jgi:phage baseplate assembly protein W|uniref:Phage tail protein n=1 Tax=Acidicaldus sp. TaxID=1872105 RepID=A0A8J4HC79_9PROT
MNDLFQQWGNDLAVSPTGDLALAAGALRGQQRVLRRLLTNPGDYIWQPSYGAGLAQFVGQPANPLQIAAVIRTQMLNEAVVAPTPAPAIDISADTTGTLSVSISYVDAPSGETQVLSFAIGNAP